MDFEDRANYMKASWLIYEIGGGTYQRIIERIMEQKQKTFSDFLTENCCDIVHILLVKDKILCDACCKGPIPRKQRRIDWQQFQAFFDASTLCSHHKPTCCTMKGRSDAIFSVDVTLGSFLLENLPDFKSVTGIKRSYLETIRHLRNRVFAHATKMTLPTDEFERIWKEATTAIEKALSFCNTGGKTSVLKEIKKIERYQIQIKSNTVDKLKVLTAFTSTEKAADITVGDEYSELRRKQNELSNKYRNLSDDIGKSVIALDYNVQLVLIGFSKSGTSSLANRIRGKKSDERDPLKPCTTKCKRSIVKADGIKLHVIDCPGLSAERPSLEYVREYTCDKEKRTVLAFIVPLNPPLIEVEGKVRHLLECLEKDSSLIRAGKQFVVFTFYGCVYSKETVQKLPSWSSLKKLLSLCNGRYVGIDNKDDKTITENVKEVIETTFKLVHGDNPLTENLTKDETGSSERQTTLVEDLVEKLDETKKEELSLRKESLDNERQAIEEEIAREAEKLIEAEDLPELENKMLKKTFELLKEKERENDEKIFKEKLVSRIEEIKSDLEETETEDDSSDSYHSASDEDDAEDEIIPLRDELSSGNKGTTEDEMNMSREKTDVDNESKNEDVFGIFASLIKMFDACKEGQLTEVERLLNAKPYLLTNKDENGRSPIILSGTSGSLELVDYLISKRCDVFDTDNKGKTIMHHACEADSRDIVEYLGKRYPKLLEVRDGGGRYPIHYAVSKGNVGMVLLLILRFYKPLRCDSEEQSTVYPELLQMRDGDGKSLLCNAVTSGSTEMVRCLVSHGFDVFETDDEGCTILHQAYKSQHRSKGIIEYLEEEYPKLKEIRDKSDRLPRREECIVS